MSSMEDIIAALVAIKEDLNAIDLTKEKDIAKIKGMGTKSIAEVDKIATREEFYESEENLKNTIGMFKEASDKVEAYDVKADAAAAVKDPTKRKEISDRINARQTVKEAIQGKYNELSAKQKVISEYTKMYDPEFFIGRQNDKLEANYKKIEANKTKIAELSDFKNNVSGELGVINTNLNLIQALEKLKGKIDEVEKKEKDLKDAKADSTTNPAVIDVFQDALNKAEAELKTQTGEITKKYPGVTLDSSNLKTSIDAAKNTANTTINTMRDKVKSKALASDKDYIKTEIHGRLDAASDNKTFVNVLKEATKEIEIENTNLDYANAAINDNINTLVIGEQVLAAGTAGAPIAEPTEEEIKKYIEDHPDIKTTTSTPDLTPEDKTKKIYESLVKDKKSKSPWLHPIAFLRSRYDKGLREDWQASYEQNMRQEAVNAIKSERQEIADKNTAAAELAASKYEKFRKKMSVYIMRSDAATVEKMDKDKDKAPGKVLVDVYDEVEAEEEEEK